MTITDLILVGAGPMASNYVDVLKAQSLNFYVVARDKNKTEKFKRKKNVNIIHGGINKLIKENVIKTNFAIVCVDAENLYQVSLSLIKNGIKNILVEKPCGINKEEIKSLHNYSQKYSTNLLIAYNRRFYETVKNARKIIEDDGGLRACFFEFTEWSHQIEKESVKDIFKEKLLLCNSTHVIDLFLFFCGKPKSISSYHKGEIKWHKNGSAFSGSGISLNNIVFSYIADWESAGRWNLELTTPKRRIYLSPLEKLYCMDRGKLDKYEVKSKNNLDKLYKPGLFAMVDSFMKNNHNDFCKIKDQLENFEIYYKIGNY